MDSRDQQLIDAVVDSYSRLGEGRDLSFVLTELGARWFPNVKVRRLHNAFEVN